MQYFKTNTKRLKITYLFSFGFTTFKPLHGNTSSVWIYSTHNSRMYTTLNRENIISTTYIEQMNH